MSELMAPPPDGEFLLYTTEDGEARLEVRIVGETVWLSLTQLAELFQRDKSVISRHIKNLFDEGELKADAVVAIFATTAADNKTYQVDYFSLGVIISVGYRVKSHRGTQFRIWATQRLREYLIKGFAMDDDRLKRNGNGNYFDELLARIRDIRSSEKMFWRKVLDIYATSIDYDPSVEASQRFFATVQNNMHWAAHGHTVAKNYLEADELDTLNRIVNFYLEFAELQALGRRPMYMADWIGKLDEFLRISEREILDGPGTVSHEQALKKAQIEFDKFRQVLINAKSPVEEHFDAAVQHVKVLEKQPRHRKKKGDV